MAIHPIEYRYGTPEMRAIWSEENRFTCLVQTEVALARAGSEFGLVPPIAADIIGQNASQARLSRAKEIEAEINHDMMAMEKPSPRCAEKLGDGSIMVQPQMTSLIP
jgi:adenylosuccinate lyase